MIGLKALVQRTHMSGGLITRVFCNLNETRLKVLCPAYLSFLRSQRIVVWLHALPCKVRRPSAFSSLSISRKVFFWITKELNTRLTTFVSERGPGTRITRWDCRLLRCPRS